jgi:hypothetical protein
LHLTTLRTFVRGNVVVVAQQGVWRAVGTGELTGAQTVASCFLVDDRRVGRFARYDSLAAALAEAGLDSADEV